MSTPKALHWVEPKPPPPPKRTVTDLDEEARAELTAFVHHADGEIARLDAAIDALMKKLHAEAPKGNILQLHLGRVVLDMERKKVKIDDQVKAWDRSGDGNVSKGEFRLHVRDDMGLKLGNEEMDALFERYDDDHSGTITIHELEGAFANARAAAVAYKPDEKLAMMEEKVAQLRKRVAKAKEAVAVSEQVIQCKEELVDFKSDMAGRVDLHLGDLLVKRGIKPGEIVSTWGKARGSEHMDHKDELAKHEWKDAILGLGLCVPDLSSPLALGSPPASPGGSPVRSPGSPGSPGSPPPTSARHKNGAPRPGMRLATRTEVSDLFDSIDADKSGWLDFEEAKDALKKWQLQSRDKMSELHRRENELMRLRQRAARSARAALRPPDPPSPPPAPVAPPSSGDEGSPNAKEGLVARLTGRAASKEFRERREAKAAAQKRARIAIKRMQKRALASGWSNWYGVWAERRRLMQLAQRGLNQMLNLEMARGWRMWVDTYLELLRVVQILHVAAAAIANKELLRGFRTWGIWLKERHELREWQEQLRKISSQCKSNGPYPKLLAHFMVWRYRWSAQKSKPLMPLASSPAVAAASIMRQEADEQGQGVSVTLTKLYTAVAECVDAAGRPRQNV